MPTRAQITQYLSLTVVPVLAGIVATWLVVHVHFLAEFHITQSSAAGELTQLGVWGVTAAITFFASHNILKDLYHGRATPTVAAGTGSHDRKVS